MNALRNPLNIRAGEGKPFFLLLTYGFFFGATLTVSKTARYAYFLNRSDIEYLPLMFLATAIVAALTVRIHSMIQKRVGDLYKTISLSGSAFAISLIVIQFRLEGGFIPFLYVWVDVINDVIIIQFWLLAGMIFDSRQSKRLFARISVGVPVAGFTMGYLIRAYVERFGSGYLLPFAAGFILCCVMMARLAKPYIQQSAALSSPPAKQTGKPSFFESYLKMIAVSVGAAAVATVIIEYQFLIIASSNFDSEEKLASFFGLFYAATGAIALFVQIFLTGWILTSRRGILKGMLALPAGLGLGSLSILISPLHIVSGLILKFSEQITKFTVNRPSYELLWVPVAPEHRYSWKPVIDIAVKTGLQGLTGVMIYTFLKKWQLPYPQLMQVLCIIALLTIGIWIWSALRLKRGRIAELMTAIEKRRLDFESMRLDATDSDIIGTIGEALESDEEAKQVFALELIEDLSLAPWRDTLNRLFQEGSLDVREKILEMAADNPEILTGEALQEAIGEGGGLAKDAIVLAGKRGMTDVVPALRGLIEDSAEGTEGIRAAAAAAILMMNQEPSDLAQSTLERLLNSEDESLNATALKMMRHMPSKIEDTRLMECLASGSVPVCMATLDIADEK